MKTLDSGVMRVSSPEAFWHNTTYFIFHIKSHLLLEAVTTTPSSGQEGGSQLHGTVTGVAVVDLGRVGTEDLIWSLSNKPEAPGLWTCQVCNLHKPKQSQPRLSQCFLINFSVLFNQWNKRVTSGNVFHCHTYCIPSLCVACHLGLIFVLKAFKSILFTF